MREVGALVVHEHRAMDIWGERADFVEQVAGELAFAEVVY